MSDSLPSRLFEVSATPFTSEDGRLICGVLRESDALSQVSPPPKYCAVSHVWGKTTRIDVSSVKWKVPVVSEEKLRFILEACRRMGYTYIWVDILCIKQDEPADSLAEMVKMEGYYGNAAATIVFGERHKDFASRWAKLEPMLDKWNEDQLGELSSTLRSVWDGLGAIDEVMQDGWFWRVWTLQEAVVPLVSDVSQLLTSDGVPMRLGVLCKLVEWSVKALALGILDENSGEAKYDWVYPRHGVVYSRGWCHLLQNLAVALEYKNTTIHPLQILNITRDRECSRAVDRLKGAYALVDPRWELPDDEVAKEVKKQSGLDKLETYEMTFHVLWQKTVARYIQDGAYDCAPLLAMRVTQFPCRTWDCATQLPSQRRDGDTWNLDVWLRWRGISASATREWDFGSVADPVGGAQVELGKWTNPTAKVTKDGELSLKVTAIEKIDVARGSFGDGSGELNHLFATLIAILPNYDVAAIVQILMIAADVALRYREKDGEDEEYYSSAKASLQKGDHRRALEYMCFLLYRDANAFSSALREVFSGWDRWIVTTGDGHAFLAWFPFRNGRARLQACSLIWTRRGYNLWAVIAEPVNPTGKHRFRKVGIAFVNCINDIRDVEAIFV